MSKIKKFLLMSVITFFILIISNSVYAREINNITELGEEIEYANPNTETVYVIGDYVFTKKITIKDVMLASTSIMVSDKTKTDEMVIYKLEKNFETKKWEPVKNYVGTKQWILSEDSPMNICYMDYDGVKNIYKVTFNTDGGNSIDSVKVHEGDTVSEPTTPTKEGYVFKGWYKEETKYEFNTPVTSDIELKAKWTKISEFSVQQVTSESPAANALKTSYEWDFPTEYRTEFNTIENNELESTINVKGLIPIVTKLKEGTFSGDHLTEYYLAFTITTKDAVTEDTTVKISGNGEDKNLTGKDFETDNKNMYILKHLHKDDKTRKFTIEIDLDGSEKDAYEPYKITVNWQYLKLQEYSSISNVEIATEGSNITDKQYDFTKNGATITEGDKTDYKLTGEVKEQVNVEKEGYYVPLKITLPKGCKDTAIVKLKTNKADAQFENLTEITTDYMGNVYLTVLVSLDKGQKSIPITLEVDLDGTGSNYCAKTYTIDCSSLTYTPARTVTFKYETGDKKVKVCDGDKVTEEAKPTKDYHTFLYWADAEGKYDFGNAVNKDIELTPHWQLDVDKFVKDVVEDLNATENSKSEDFSEQFYVLKKDNTIEFNVKKLETALETLLNTTIPSSIEFVLDKEEITEIKMIYKDTEKATFKSNDTKETIKSKIETVLEEIANDTTSGMETMSLEGKTLNDILGKEFTLKITGFDKKTIEIPDGSDKYTFKFESNCRIVDNETELTNALKEDSVTTIIIGADFEVENGITIDGGTKNITIVSQGENKKTITSKHELGNHTIFDEQGVPQDKDVTAVFKVSSGNVIFENLNIKGATRAISVLAGATVTAKNVSAIDSQDTGFDVASGAKFTGTQLQYLQTTDKGETKNKESYHYPTICGLGTVNVTDVDEAKIENYERIIRTEYGTLKEEDFINPETGKVFENFADADGNLKEEYKNDTIERKNHPDYLGKTGHTHYYLDKENSKYYTFYFRDSRVNLIIIKYYAKGDTIVPPVDNSYNSSDKENAIHFFRKAYTMKGTTYVRDGWSAYEDDDDNGVNTKSSKITEFQFPSNENDKINYYTRYSIGYMVTIDMQVGEKTKKGIFGIVKPEGNGKVTIGDLMKNDSEFEIAFNALKKDGKFIVDKSDESIEVSEDTEITKNMELIQVDSLKKSAMTNAQMPSIDGLTTSGNTISGVLKTKMNGKYYLPVTLTSANFQDEAESPSVVKVTGPNNYSKIYTYSSVEKDEIATVDNENTMIIPLEAIKQSNITSGRKVYEIAVDVDGVNRDEYAVKTYTVDWSGVQTEEEAINVAAEATKNATSITLTNKNTTNGTSQNWTEQYNKAENRRLITDNETGEKSYTFSSKGNKFYDYRDYRDLYKDHNSNLAYTDSISYDPTTKNPGEYYNGWRYNNNGYHGFGNIEIELLYDTKKDGETIQAISKIEKVDDITYKVTITKERFDNWLDEYYGIIDYQYEVNENLTNPEELGVTGDVVLTITLTSDAKYISSIKSDTITINKGTKGNETRTIDITISDANNTDVPDIYEILKIETEENKQEIVEDFVARGRQWWIDNK